MREILFRGTFDPGNDTDGDAGIPPQVKRRQFLQMIGVVGIGLTLFPKELFGQCAGAEGERWRDTVNHFIRTVADPQQAASMTQRLDQASVDLDSTYTGFHDFYASPYIFRGTTINPEPVICSNGFQVNRLPYYDAQCPCRLVNDLNAPEIHAITNPLVIAQVNCVLTPDGYRTKVDMSNSDHSTRYREAASENGEDHREWHPAYGRRLRGHSRAHTGYLLIHKTQKNRRGYPKTRFIVSSNI